MRRGRDARATGRRRRHAAHPPAPERALRGPRRRGGFRVGRGRVTLSAGEAVTVPAGTPHAFRNIGETGARFRAEVRPALHFEELVAAMFALAEDGRTSERGMPNMLQLAVIADAYADTIRVPFPPAFIQRIGLALVAPMARRLGYRADTWRRGPQSSVRQPSPLVG